MERDAERDAGLFVDASAGQDLQALPVFLTDMRLAAAQTIWREFAPRLDKLHLLTALDRYSFAMFCIYAAEFVLANRDVLDKGYSVMVTTIAGAKSKAKGNQMPRLNPSVTRRDFAYGVMLDLGQKFGLTPLDRANLISKHALNADDESLFGRSRTPVAPAADPADTPEAQAVRQDDGERTLGIGQLGQLDTPGRDKLN